jgi:ribosomal protein S18 acetylase RimI-like enzyme
VWSIESLKKRHRREAFDCEIPELNEFLKKYARQSSSLNISRTYVATSHGEMDVLGYYTLRAGQAECAQLPPAESRRLPRYPVPVVHLARLAVHKNERGKGLGEFLLVDALRRMFRAGTEIGAFAVEVIAKNEAARRFYLKYGFHSLLDDQLHLYLSMKTLKKLFGDR